VNFRPDLAAAVMAGTKTVTRRIASKNPRSPWYLHGCSLVVGRDYAVCPGRGKNAIGRVRIVSLGIQPVGNLTDLEAQREGFPDAFEFERAWVDINGAYDKRTLVWRVAFEVVT
jgi:hypothetical protein